jgi:hypothetical protein
MYQISDKTYEFERSLPVTIAFMTGTVQTTICRHISVDDLPVSDLILQLFAFFSRFCSSCFPLSQTKVSHFMQCSTKITYIFPRLKYLIIDHFDSYRLDSKFIRFWHFFNWVISLPEDKMVSVPCKSNRQNKKFDYNFLNIYRTLNVVDISQWEMNFLNLKIFQLQ